MAAIIAGALVFTSMGALEGGLSDLAIQTERVAYFHDQHSIDWTEVAQWAGTGALTAGVGAGAGAGLRAVAATGAPVLARIGARLGVSEPGVGIKRVNDVLRDAQLLNPLNFAWAHPPVDSRGTSWRT